MAHARRRSRRYRAAREQGDWVAALSGNIGCGISSMLVTFHLDAQGSGVGTAKVTGHSTGCRDKTTRGLDFSIIRLGVHGKGEAGLTNDTMALTDVAPENPNNTLTGTAIKQ